MKLFFLASAIIAVTACNMEDRKTGSTTSDKSPSMSDTANYTTIQWLDSTFQDRGKINEGQAIEVTYTFKNTGDKPLIIANATASCGCTVPERPKEPIMPGEVGKIRAKFDSKGQGLGEKRKDVYVTSNTKPNAMSTLSFRVEVEKLN